MSLMNNEAGRVRQLLLILVAITLCTVPIGTAPTTIAALTLIGCWVLSGKTWWDRGTWLRQSWSVPVLMVMLLQIGSLAWSQNLQFGIKLAERSYYWLLGFAALSAMPYARNLRGVAWAYLAGLSVSVCLSLLQIGKIADWHHMTLTGYITYSLLLVAGMLILSYFFKEATSQYVRMALLGAMGVYFLNLALLPGRSGYIAFMVALPLMLLNLFGKRNLLKILICFVVAVAALLSSPVVRQRLAQIPAELQSYNKATTADEKTTSVGLRMYMWQGAAKIFLDHPVAGVGTGGYIAAMEKYKHSNDPNFTFAHPHSSFLYIAASYGLIGIVLYGWLFWVLLRDSWLQRETVGGWLVFSFLLVFLVGSLTDTQLLSHATGILLGLLPGLLPARQVTA